MSAAFHIEGVIGQDVTPASVRASLEAYAGQPVTVHVNSPGGIVTQGIGIFHALSAHAPGVTIVVDGVAASAASLIAMAGREIVMRDGALIMIHPPSAMTIGTAHSHRQSAAVLEKMADGIVAIYAKRTGIPPDRVRTLMEAETWMDGDEAVELGFADRTEATAAADPVAFDFSIFNNAPAHLLGAQMELTAMPPAAAAAAVTAPATDVTHAIMMRCDAAKMSLTETLEIVSQAAGSVEKAKDLIINKFADRDTQPESRSTVVVNDNTMSNPDFQAKAIEGALYARLTGRAPEGPAVAFEGKSVIALMHDRLTARGIKCSSRPDAIWQATMGASGMHSTSDFPILLANVLGNRLLELFKAAPSGAAAIAAIGTVPDFRPMPLTRLSSFPELLPVPEGAEIKWGTLEEEGQSIAIASFARAIGVSFQLLVNDNLGGVEKSIRDIAFATGELRSKLIIAALGANLSDGLALFHASHGNLASPGTVPDVESLSAARLAMRQQRALDGKTPLGIAPRYLLVPSELETEADKLVTAISATETENVNPFAGKLTVVVEPRLTDATGWTLFADPAIYDVVKFMTLEGFPAPRLEVNQEFTRLGSAYRVHWHCGAGPIDYRGAYFNPGDTEE